MSTIKEVTVEQTKSPKSPTRRRIVVEDELPESRHSSVVEELSEKDVRPVLSPITSPVKAPSPPTRVTPNRSLRTMSQTEKSIARSYSEDRQTTASSLAHKYRRKMS